MPPRLSPPSLRGACLSAVALQLDQLTVGSYEDKIAFYDKCEERGWCVDGESPLAQLPSEVLNDLVEAAKHEGIRLLRRHHLHLLLRPPLSAINLSYGIGEMYYAMKFIAERCPTLQRLDLSYQRPILPHIILTTVEALPNLRILNLCYTLCTDDTLAILGQNCPHLVALDVTDCPVGDKGLRLMCGGLAGDGGCCRPGPPNTRIRSLRMRGTRVTPDGAAFALWALPALREFTCDMLLIAMERCLQYGLDRPLNLDSLWATGEGIGAGLSAAVTLCPQASHVSLTKATHLTDDQLLPLHALYNLNKVVIGGGEGFEGPSFEGGVLPVVANVGSRLHTLHLSNLDEVDLGLVGRLCTGIQDLELMDVAQYVGEEEDDQTEPYAKEGDWKNQPYAKLLRLKLAGSHGAQIPAGALRRLLHNCRNLEELHVKRCTNFDDGLLADLVDGVNRLCCLRRIHLEKCHALTEEGPLLALASLDGSPLSTLRIWACDGLGSSWSQALIQLLRRHHLDLLLDWSD